MIHPTIKTAISTSGYVAIRLRAGLHCKSFSLWTEDSADYYMSSLSDGSDAIIVPNGFPMNVAQNEDKDSAGRIVCYAKGTTATNLVGLITK